MLLRSRTFACPLYINVSKRLLSNQIKEIFDIPFAAPSGTKGSQLQLSVVSKNLNALNLDLFVNTLGKNDDRTSSILDLLVNLRATKYTNTCLESTHFATVRHLLENLTIQEVIPVLLDRPKYGIFLNNFTSFAVFQTLHENQEYVLGLPLAVKLILAEEVDCAFVQAFCLKASLETLKKELEDKPGDEQSSQQVPKGKVQEIKVRVKFIRNVLEPDTHNEIAKCILKIGSKVLDKNTHPSGDILRFVLTKNYAELDKALSVNSIEINTDIADICKKLLMRLNKTDYANKIDQLQSKSMTFENVIDTFLKEIAIKEVDALAEEQKQLLPIWQKVREQRITEFEIEEANKARKDNIDVITNEISTKKELLWFFENEDKLDLEIHNKKVTYPKRWFGKKKKPRVADEHYVPPQVRKIG